MRPALLRLGVKYFIIQIRKFNTVLHRLWHDFHGVLCNDLTKTRVQNLERLAVRFHCRNLPVMHCLRGSDGWQFPAELRDLSVGSSIFEKGSFGSLELAEYVRSLNPDAIEVIGLCTDICVLANVALLKAYCPEVPMTVRASCCAGVTPEAHENALNAMKALQVEIL